MKLIAIKHISTQIPNGAVFEIDDRKARVLLAVKAAKPYAADADSTTAPAPPKDEPPQPAPQPPAAEPPAPAPETPADDPKPRRGRSFPIGHRPA